ncbi:MAG: DUF5683 domain-containing protein [Candidatus Latescibacter sp.]|nr:DUF5683 domain-containing protein [Candidatus Latescibacter sp.]
MDGNNAGETPLRDFTVTEGIHTIAIARMGYETYREQANVSQSAPVNISPVLIPKTKRSVLMRSIFVPGTGQYYAEYKGKGVLISVLQIAAIAGVVGTTLSANTANTDYEDALTAYRSITQTEFAKFPDARIKVRNTYDKASQVSTVQLAVIGIAAAVYVWNLVDAAFTEPRVEMKPPSNAMHLEPRIESNECGISLAVRF